MATLGDEQNISLSSPPVAKDRDAKLKLVRERQNEEKLRKIEELKIQAEASQRYRDQTEKERRQRIDQLKKRDSEKRLQIEERRRTISEAEKERREYIARKNQEIERRLETKKHNRKSYGYVFGSSTPRMLEPSSRNSSYASRSSTSNTPNSSGSRSGTISPRSIMSTSMPASALSMCTSLSASVCKIRSVSIVRKPRPASMADTKASFAEINHIKKDQKPSVKCAPNKSAQISPRRVPNLMTTSLIVASTRISSTEKKNPLKASTPKMLAKASSYGHLNKPSLMTRSAYEMSTSAFSSDAVARKTISDTADKNKNAKNDAMTASTTVRPKILTEEEAKAALSERRRRFREEAERVAALEQQRLEAENLAETRRQEEEETERRRQFEEKAARLANEQRMAEEDSLRQSIAEATRRDDAAQRIRDEEERQRLGQAETEIKAQVETDKQRLQVAERLADELKDRDERRKRVEAIMSRTKMGGVTKATNSKAVQEIIESISY